MVIIRRLEAVFHRSPWNLDKQTVGGLLHNLFESIFCSIYIVSKFVRARLHKLLSGSTTMYKSVSFLDLLHHADKGKFRPWSRVGHADEWSNVTQYRTKISSPSNYSESEKYCINR